MQLDWLRLSYHSSFIRTSTKFFCLYRIHRLPFAVALKPLTRDKCRAHLRLLLELSAWLRVALFFSAKWSGKIPWHDLYLFEFCDETADLSDGELACVVLIEDLEDRLVLLFVYCEAIRIHDNHCLILY